MKSTKKRRLKIFFFPVTFIFWNSSMVRHFWIALLLASNRESTRLHSTQTVFAFGCQVEIKSIWNEKVVSKKWESKSDLPVRQRARAPKTNRSNKWIRRLDDWRLSDVCWPLRFYNPTRATAATHTHEERLRERAPATSCNRFQVSEFDWGNAVCAPRVAAAALCAEPSGPVCSGRELRERRNKNGGTTGSKSNETAMARKKEREGERERKKKNSRERGTLDHVISGYSEKMGGAYCTVRKWTATQKRGRIKKTGFLFLGNR